MDGYDRYPIKSAIYLTGTDMESLWLYISIILACLSAHFLIQSDLNST